MTHSLVKPSAAAVKSQPATYRPPRPTSWSAVAAFGRAVWRGDGDLLSLLPASAYKVDIGPLGYSRRSILVVNAPELTRTILTDPADIYPKNDLMTGALAPLVGDSMFVSHGEAWRKQRRMIDPAFTQLRLAKAFGAMEAALDDYEERLAGQAERSEVFSLDLAMSQLTADIICRTVFSASLANETARDVFESFGLFERSVAHVELKRLILGKPFEDIPQRTDVLQACQRIRGHIGSLLDTHLAAGASFDDIASNIIGASDPLSGDRFTREELIDQLGVFFLAGHETTASALIWAFFIASERPEVAARIREETQILAGNGPVTLEHTKRMIYTRNVFRETMRLYPPITFIPRVAAEAQVIGGVRVKRGAMVMIAPWTIHRHQKLWRNPDVFDPDRFLPEREQEMTPGAYLPFGSGPRVCVGAAFATMEATLILARLVRRFSFDVLDAHRVRPVARLTTRPMHEVMVRARANSQ